MTTGAIHLWESYILDREIESYQSISYKLIDKVMRPICALLSITGKYSLAYLTDKETEEKLEKML